MNKINKFLVLIQLVLSNVIYQSSIRCAAIIQTEQRETNPDLSLIAAVKIGNELKVMKLIDSNANVNTSDNFGYTPLFWAAGNGNNEIIELLLNAKANVNTANRSGWTPLILASFNGRKEATELLLTFKANINTANMAGDTALISSVMNWHIEIAELLLKAGADIELSTKYGNKKAIDFAREVNNREMIKLLENELPRRKNKITECQKIISTKILNLPYIPLINDIIRLISQYTIDKYDEVLAFENDNQSVITMLLNANKSLTINNKLKRKAENDENSTDKKKVRIATGLTLSNSAFIAFILQLK